MEQKQVRGRAFLNMIGGLVLALIGLFWISGHWLLMLLWALFALGIVVYYTYKIITA